MDDSRVGAAFRAVRIRRKLRQKDVADRAGVSASVISDIERGHVGGLALDTLRRLAGALDIRIDVVARWRGGELDRLLNHRHATLAGAVVEFLAEQGWDVAPEVSFAISGERGWIDVLAWHAPTRTLLVVEVKTELVDVHELLGVVDRKVRLAPQIARQRGWHPSNVASWVVMAEGSTNRHRVRRFDALLRSAFPADTRTMDRWLRRPVGSIAGLSFFSNFANGDGKQEVAGRQRVRVARSRRAERGSEDHGTSRSPRQPDLVA